MSDFKFRLKVDRGLTECEFTDGRVIKVERMGRGLSNFSAIREQDGVSICSGMILSESARVSSAICLGASVSEGNLCLVIKALQDVLDSGELSETNEVK